MTTNTVQTTTESRLILPALAPLYAALSPVSVTVMRLIAGATMIVHGWPKIQAPLGAVGMVESIGFYPGALWATLLAITEFVGGILVVLGFLTRPAAAAMSVVLMVTTWFHWVKLEQGFGGAELSLIWLGVMIYFAVHGAGRWSVDRMIGRQF